MKTSAIFFALFFVLAAWAVTQGQVTGCNPDHEFTTTLVVTPGTTEMSYTADAGYRDNDGCRWVSATVHPKQGFRVVGVTVNHVEREAGNTVLVKLTEDTEIVFTLELIEPEVMAAKYEVYLPYVEKG